MLPIRHEPFPLESRLSQIDRIANQTEFNGLKLLDGSFTSQAFQVGANAGQTISVNSIVDARAAALGRFSLVADGTVTGNVVLGSTNNGIAAEANLTVTVGSQTSGQISYAADAGANAIASAINTAAGSLGVTATASNSATLGSLSAAGVVSFSINGQAISANVTDTSDLTALAAAINGVSSNSGVTASFTNPSDKSQLTLSTTDGRNIAISAFSVSTAGTQTISFDGTTMTEGAAATDTAVKTGTIELVSAKQLTVSNANADVFPAAGTNSASFDAVSLIDISSASGADKAIKIVDQALSAINSARADMGAVQNRFMSVIASLQTTSENLSASRSRIRDTDFAKETAELTRTQILVQAGTAMLAQANQAPQNVLSLLR
ncbi:flagellin [Thermomonas hydrothermalis]|uniref:Flagellin n=1 Tax=Thermomonas hydrothermalis TaxID=213588 RepID=A0A1M5AUB6_9GAMM|nr:flagellin [Thermomonas hydrothermalis]SHF33667.1 flagellin [Thermomonas hydrothermalis]